jgi:hypothetical protein
MREGQLVGVSLEGYSHYLEGRAKLGQSRPAEAAEHFKMAVTSKYEKLDLIICVADSLNGLGYAAFVKDFLAMNEKKGSEALSYWQTVYKTAVALKDDSLLARATNRIHALIPNERVLQAPPSI